MPKLSRKLPQKELKRLEYALDPVKFQRVYLNRLLWQKQKEIAEAVDKYRSVSVRGCHASGKTYLASGIPLNWLARYRETRILVTAPTRRQTRVFWDEIYTAWSGGYIRNQLPEPLSEGLRVSAERWAIGATSSRGVNLAGLHSKNVLVIVDEAPGIEQRVWDALEGARSGGNVHMLALGNPVVPSGYFYDQHTKERRNHHCIQISAFDTPNLHNPVTGQPFTIEEIMSMDDDTLDTCLYPALITRRWVKERLIGWGPNHPKFQSRVLGEFPQESPYQVFPLAWIERAKREPTEKEWEEAKRYGIQIGIDVAGPGDDETVCTARVLGIILRQGVFPEADPLPRVMQWISQLVRDFPQYRLALIVVDIIGIGYNFALRIADNNPTWTGLIRGFRADGKPLDPTQFKDQKAESAFTLRAWMKDNLLSNLEDEETEAQLCTILYQENSRGLSQLESKEDLRKKGVGSPDRAESLMMAFHRVVPQQQTVTYDSPRVQISPI